jgi:hypothetical protein
LGYRRLGKLLAPVAMRPHHKKLLQIYREEGLNKTLFASLVHPQSYSLPGGATT